MSFPHLHVFCRIRLRAVREFHDARVPVSACREVESRVVDHADDGHREPQALDVHVHESQEDEETHEGAIRAEQRWPTALGGGLQKFFLLLHRLSCGREICWQL